MKHKAWFRLLLKAIGVLSIVLSLPEFVAASIGFVSEGIQSGFAQFEFIELLVSILYYVGKPAIGIGIGLYLIFGGAWLVNLCIPSNRPYCPECGYDLSESSHDRCPECGVNIAHMFVTRIKEDRPSTSMESDNSGHHRNANQGEHDSDKPLQ
jgi:hypothetical protein